ncbi:MAG TPA: type II toxin-antitoxin system VapC family toxin [Candidatus Aquilonibacter sp.]|nr:type II toxin-antitoxin system VapC family toxin [Candidatus Aquilonibacter sp.]
MSDVVIFDTSVLVDEARTGRHRKKIESVEGVIRMSSVVLAELLRGVAGPAEHKFLRTLARNHPVLTPTQENWLESGEILSRIHAEHGFEPHKLRDLHFDVLIALTARSHGARLITINRRDFELIHRYRRIKLEVW